MIQKYLKTDTIILVPDAIPLIQREEYTYEWYMNGILIGNKYETHHRFSKEGINEVKLVMINKESKLVSYSIKTINISFPEQKWIEPIIGPPA